jgi:HicA toxin of bacterial toxin-antitoxin,
VSEGETRGEALAMIKEAIEGYLESLEAHGHPVPRPDIERVTVGAWPAPTGRHVPTAHESSGAEGLAARSCSR